MISNLALVEILANIIEKYPEQRFSQILCNFGFVINQPMGSSQNMVWKDEFYLESDKLLERVKNVTRSL
jgi:hypothetical protein